MKRILLMFLCLVGICGGSQKVCATDYSWLTEIAPEICNIPSLDEEGNAYITWGFVKDESMEEEASIVYEVQVARDTAFTNAKKYSTKEATLILNKTEFGKNGGTFYARVRLLVDYVDATQSDLVGDWSEPEKMVFVKINKTNFPGMYEVLKNGGKHSTVDGVKKLIYDKNKDGWLDPVEINDIWMIGTLDESKKVNGVYKITKAPTISGFKGIEYFDHLHSVYVARFSGKKADFSKSSATMIDIRGISAKQITVNAPNAKNVFVEADYDNKMTKIDLSKCGKAVEVYAYGNEGTKTLKLPKNKKNLKILSVSEIGVKSLNMNAYTKLQQLYVYDSDMKSVKVNKCKNLRYIYFWYCEDINNLDLKSNNKLRGADFYKTPGLTGNTVKKSKSGKYTWNKGKWWYSTSAYKKDMKKIYN